MSSRTIIFAADSVRAILAGRKTQSRRVIGVSPSVTGEPELAAAECDHAWHWRRRDGACEWHLDCQYGEPGDRLCVKESFRFGAGLDGHSPATVGEMALDAGYHIPWAPIRYEADGSDRDGSLLSDFGGGWGRLRSPIHMPRWASRITLEVTGVRVERLQDISEDDAIAEGARASDAAVVFQGCGHWHDDIDEARVCPDTRRHPELEGSARGAFAILWDRINGKRAPWASNPWVWVVAFRRTSMEADA